MVLCFHIKNAWFYHLSQAQLPVKIQYTMKKSYISCDIANAISIWILGAPSCEEVFNKLTIYNGAHKIYGKFQLRPPCAKLAHLKQPPFVYKGLTQKKYGLIQNCLQDKQYSNRPAQRDHGLVNPHEKAEFVELGKFYLSAPVWSMSHILKFYKITSLSFIFVTEFKNQFQTILNPLMTNPQTL